MIVDEEWECRVGAETCLLFAKLDDVVHGYLVLLAFHDSFAERVGTKKCSVPEFAHSLRVPRSAVIIAIYI